MHSYLHLRPSFTQACFKVLEIAIKRFLESLIIRVIYYVHKCQVRRIILAILTQRILYMTLCNQWWHLLRPRHKFSKMPTRMSETRSSLTVTITYQRAHQSLMVFQANSRPLRPMLMQITSRSVWWCKRLWTSKKWFAVVSVPWTTQRLGSVLLAKSFLLVELLRLTDSLSG